MTKIMRISVLLAIIVVVFLSLVNAQNYYSQGYYNVNESKYSLKLNIWNTKLTGDFFAPSNSFTTDFQDDLGFGDTKSSFTFDFNYRLSNINGIGLSIFSSSQKAVRTLTRNITLPGEPNDVNVAAGTTVFSKVNYSTFDLYYRRYFSTASNYEFYGLLGVRFNNLKVDFSTNGGPLASLSGNFPTAYLGFGGSFNLSENFKTYYNVQGLGISLSSNKLSYIEYNLGLEYKLNNNFSVNVGYRYNGSKFKNDLSREANLKYQGLTFGVGGRF
jgi:opacity protein-like surface antigen